MLLFLGVVFIATFASVSAECEIINGTVSEGQVLIDTGCHQTICEDGEIVKKKICPEDFTMIKWGGHRSSCVKIIHQRTDWNTAYKKCAEMSVGESDIGQAKLVETNNNYEYAKVLAFSQRFQDSNSNETATNILHTTSSYLLRELNQEDEEDILDRWDIKAQIRNAEDQASPCGSDITCMNGDECVPGSFCDGNIECSDGSDEDFCGGTYEYWMGGNNERNPNVVAWVTSNMKVKQAPVPERSGLCLAVANGDRTLFDCDFEGLYPLCEVCASNYKVDNGCEYNDKLYRDGSEVDRQECGKLICKGGEIVEDFLCSPGYKHITWEGGAGCYKLYKGSYTNAEAKEMCKAPIGLKKMSVLSGEKEGIAVGNFLNDEGVAGVKVWLDYIDMEGCTNIAEGSLNFDEDCEQTAHVLCESCYSESEQEEDESESPGCTYLSIEFDKGDQLEPDQKSCTATVCQGKGQWEIEYFGSGCCEVNTTIIEPGPTDQSKFVADEDGSDCSEVNCKNGELVEKDIICGCKGENDDIFPHEHSISRDLKACQEKYCDAGTIKTKSIVPVSSCAKCFYRGRYVTRTHYACSWLNRRFLRCQVGYCTSTGYMSIRGSYRGSSCRSRSNRSRGCR